MIAFTGYKWRDAENPKSGEIPRDEATANTVKGLKALARDAERHGVTIVLEHLNTRVTGHDFKGHPGYQGDDIDYCADIIRQVGSPRVKLLFDIYHVQIMHGDIIGRIRQYGSDLIGHVHTAGVPGRGELDDDAGAAVRAADEGAAGGRLQRLRRPRVHPDPKRDGGAAAGDDRSATSSEDQSS